MIKQYNRYKEMINVHLSANDKDFDLDTVNNVPNYVLDMCIDLLRTVQKNGNHHATIDDILEIDTSCCGHSDYVHKFALRLCSLEQID